MARYEMRDSRGPKFWTIAIDGRNVHTGQGRVGAEPKESVQQFPSPAEAERAAARLVLAKTKKGFVEVVSAVRASEHPARPELDALAASITQNPDDLDACAVYADALMDRGDPFGEALSLHVAIAKETETKRRVALKLELQALRTSDRIFGAVAPHLRRLELGWRRGVIETVRIKTGPAERGVSNAALLGMLFTLPVARFVSRLTFPGFTYVDFSTAVPEIIDAGGLRTLRALEVEPAGGPGMTSRMKLARIGALAELRSLSLPFERFDASGLALPALETLALTNVEFYSGPAPIAEADLPNVTRIALPYHTQNGIAPLAKFRAWHIARLTGLIDAGAVERFVAAVPALDTFELDGMLLKKHMAGLAKGWPALTFLTRGSGEQD